MPNYSEEGRADYVLYGDDTNFTDELLSVLQESPFTDRGSVVELLTDLTVWNGIRGVIEEINGNAVA